MSLDFDALLFDCDGVIAETERDAHRISFNDAFKSKGIIAEWSVEDYGELLKIGGGKERMTKYFNDKGWPASIPESARVDTIAALHKLKTNLFQGVIEAGGVPLRPGVQRLVDEALSQGLRVAVCSTSNELAVTTIVRKLLGEDRLSKMKIFAGDVVAKKKPSPDVYLLAASTLGVDPARCWVVEDSNIGLRAAKAAGMRCCVTKSIYTSDENFEGADIIVKDLDRGM
jgi:HAD superfamily hydrolase (TIGR01509 family)